MRLLGVVATLITVDSTTAGLKLAAKGKADAMFAERMTLKNLLDHQYPNGPRFASGRWNHNVVHVAPLILWLIPGRPAL